MYGEYINVPIFILFFIVDYMSFVALFHSHKITKNIFYRSGFHVFVTFMGEDYRYRIPSISVALTFKNNWYCGFWTMNYRKRKFVRYGTADNYEVIPIYFPDFIQKAFLEPRIKLRRIIFSIMDFEAYLVCGGRHPSTVDIIIRVIIENQSKYLYFESPSILWIETETSLEPFDLAGFDFHFCNVGQKTGCQLIKYARKLN